MTEPAWPLKKEPAKAVKRQCEFIDGLPMLRTILNAVSEAVMVLNPSRQIVCFNQAAEKFISCRRGSPRTGLRPGEALRCIHASETGRGCGTSESCGLCGTAQVLGAQPAGTSSPTESRITQAGTGDVFDLLLRAAPLQADGKTFTVLTISDISDQKRRRALERIFFHDVLNTAAVVQGFTYLLQEALPDRWGDIAATLKRVSEAMVEEIKAQRDLTAAEDSELAIERSPAKALEVLQEIIAMYRDHKLAHQRTLALDSKARDTAIVTDRMLLRRVIGNLIKNALEASKPGETVTVGCAPRGEKADFWVHNPGVIPRDVQLQLFHRSYSTKGSGRGLGAYSAKLLTERYLKGTIFFTSDEGHGTKFVASYPAKL